jgi:hypothetical protein
MGASTTTRDLHISKYFRNEKIFSLALQTKDEDDVGIAQVVLELLIKR